MVKCTFCGIEIERGTGKIFVKSDGKILYFCKRKCEKNMLILKRKSRNYKWTENYDKSEKVKTK